MCFSSTHTKWLIKTGENLEIADGKKVQVWAFCHDQKMKKLPQIENGEEVKVWVFLHGQDEQVLSAWAKHVRNYYCLDSEIDDLCKCFGYSRKEYLLKIKFPDRKTKPGPSIRAGDFGEILVADFLEYRFKYTVPRTRYDRKASRNESTKGCDVIGFHIVNDGNSSSEDKLAIFEVKTEFSVNKTEAKSKLQEAVNGSAKDPTRKAESLNAIRQRLTDRHERDNAEKIGRFQNEADQPYKEVYDAVVLFDNKVFNGNGPSIASSTDTSSHPHPDNLTLMVIKGSDMMPLVHALYERAADEA